MDSRAWHAAGLSLAPAMLGKSVHMSEDPTLGCPGVRSNPLRGVRVRAHPAGLLARTEPESPSPRPRIRAPWVPFCPINAGPVLGTSGRSRVGYERLDCLGSRTLTCRPLRPPALDLWKPACYSFAPGIATRWLVACLGADEVKMRTIRRYSTRKMYDMSDGRYVNLSRIATLIRAGEDIRVLEQTTERDLTSATMAQIVFEEERRHPRLALSGLRGIIRTGQIA